MLPTVGTFNIYTPVQSLVATQIPETHALRVPNDNVTPAISTSQLNPNARGNGNVPTPAQQAEAPVVATPIVSGSPAFISTTPSGLSASMQATFLAQMLSQMPANTPGGLRSMMNEYEKMATFSAVKYLPSNATLPEPEPTSVFERFLQQEKNIARPTAQQLASTIQQQAPATTQAGVTAPQPRVTAASGTAKNAPPTANNAEPEPETNSLIVTPAPIPFVTISAYTATISRQAELDTVKSE